MMLKGITRGIPIDEIQTFFRDYQIVRSSNIYQLANLSSPQAQNKDLYLQPKTSNC